MIVILTDRINTMLSVNPKHLFGVAAVLSISLIGLVGCSGTPGEGNNSASPTITQVLLNPTVPGSAEPVTVINVNESVLNVKFLGAGYPTISELETLSPDSKATPEPNSELVAGKKVLALSFEYVNNSTDFPIADFVFGETKINGNPASHGVNDSALYAMLGAPSFPLTSNTANPVIQTGETGTWSIDVLLPDDVIDDSTVEVEQALTISGTPVVVTFNVNLERKTPAPTTTSNGE